MDRADFSYTGKGYGADRGCFVSLADIHTTLNALEELDNLHKIKAKLLLEVTATINLAQQSISKSLKLSREIKALKGYPGDSVVTEHQKL